MVPCTSVWQAAHPHIKRHVVRQRGLRSPPLWRTLLSVSPSFSTSGLRGTRRITGPSPATGPSTPPTQHPPTTRRHVRAFCLSASRSGLDLRPCACNCTSLPTRAVLHSDKGSRLKKSEKQCAKFPRFWRLQRSALLPATGKKRAVECTTARAGFIYPTNIRARIQL